MKTGCPLIQPYRTHKNANCTTACYRSNWFDETLHISPLADDCEQRFRYLLTGKIQNTESADLPAATMIEKLALDIAYLTRRRQEAITGIFDDQFILSASEAELTHLVQSLR